MLTANQSMITLGKIRNSHPIQFKYTLTNKADKPIKIDSITVGCGSCTVASTDTVNVGVGETTNINVVFTPASPGAQIKSVAVHYILDEKKFSLSLKFSSEVI